MKVLIIIYQDKYYDVFSFDGGIISHPSLTDFVNCRMAEPHSEPYEIRSICVEDVDDTADAKLNAIDYLSPIISEQNDPAAISAFFTLYDSNEAYDGVQLD